MKFSAECFNIRLQCCQVDIVDTLNSRNVCLGYAQSRRKLFLSELAIPPQFTERECVNERSGHLIRPRTAFRIQRVQLLFQL
jgi:hypothetical protein